MTTVSPLRSVWTDADDSDGQETAVSSTSPSPMSLATLVAPSSHRSSWFSQSGTVPNKLKKPLSEHPSRRASVMSTSRATTENLRDPAKGTNSVDSSVDGAISTPYDIDSPSSHTSWPTPPRESSSRSSSGTHSLLSPTPKKRGSLLVTATDVFAFRFARRRKSVRQSSMPIVLPDVIEISASRRDDEVEERERLRDAAAQSIGLDPILMSTEEPVQEVDETETSTTEHQNALDSEQTLDDYAVVERHSPEISHSRKPSYNEGPIRIPKPLNQANIPDFPSTITILTDFTQSSASLIKYYPATSLRFFAFGKSWKGRFLILSSNPLRASQGASPSFLHLFRSSHPEETELERLEINEESVVFVSDEDVGGRKNVVKVGGIEVGASKEVPHKAMWFLQISDPPEAQRWITLIKNIILSQRSMRAGLGIPANTQAGNEPRGDMDVMLSMRAQGIITSLTVGSLRQTNHNGSRSSPAKVPHPFATHDQNCAASISSQSSRSQAPSPKPQVLAVSALKGLFSTRPRSPSQSISIDEGSERETNEDSFGNVGTNLLGLARFNGTPDFPSSSSSVLKRSYHTSSILDYKPTSPSSSGQRLDRKIVLEQQGTSWPVREPPLRPNRALSLASFSLQPAPRRRPWTIGTQTSPAAQPTTFHESSGNTTPRGESSSAALPPSPSFSGLSFGTPEQKTRAPSVRSVSTFASGDNGSNMDRSSLSAKTRRWSRQGAIPKRLSPPNGPPPAIPQSQSPRFPNSNYPYLSEEDEPNCQSFSSIPSAISQTSVRSGLPSFSKRNSNSSGLSVSSGNAYPTHAVTRTGGAYRTSVPPPRPAPTFAPPPAPDHDALSPRSASTTDSASSPRSPSFRSSFSHRSFRLSLTAPKPPPLTNLPPRPDEPEYPIGPSSSSSSSLTHSTDLYPIPGSSIPKMSPKPPPTYPLPPTPVPFSVSPSNRNPSFKQRLRILSAPSPTTVPSVPEDDSSPGPSLSPLYPLIKAYQGPGLAYTPPATPIGEQITQYQDDPSFLQMQTPIATRSTEVKTVRRLPLLPNQNVTFPEVMSLSPPPRRGSRQLPFIEQEDSPKSNTLEIPSVLPDNDKLMSLSRHGSVISLGIVSM